MILFTTLKSLIFGEIKEEDMNCEKTGSRINYPTDYPDSFMEWRAYIRDTH